MVYVGTCGYSYRDWIGPFYPATTKPREMLALYARQFPAVEIDASYYGVLPEKTVAAMAARTPAEFRFCFKVPSAITHGREASTVASSEAKALLDSLRPVQESGKLGCVLLQFPNAFHPTPQAQTYVGDVVHMLEPLPMVAEFRHRDWQSARTLELLAELRVGWCNVDMPAYGTLPHASSEVTSPVGYVRFHGRNAEKWWTGTSVTRYQYDYSGEELGPWCDRVAEIDESAQTTFAFFNNHARGNAARNAERFTELLRSRFGDAIRLPARRPVQGPSQQRLF